MRPTRKRLLVHVLATISVMFLVYSPSYGSDSSVLDEARVSRLLKTLGTKSLAIPVPAEIQESKDQGMRDDYFAKRKLQFDAFEAEIDAAMTELVSMGDAIIEPLVGGLLKGGPDIDRASLEVRVPEVLARMETPQAMDTLLEMALGRSPWAYPNHVALHHFLQKATADDARRLLTSDDPEVLLKTLQRSPGIRLDLQLLARLEQLLQAKGSYAPVNVSLRQRAASVIAKDTNRGIVDKKVAAIVNSVRTVEGMPAADEKFQPNVPGTLADNMYSYLISALARIEGSGPELKRAMANDDLSKTVMYCIALARGLAGDPEVRSQLRQILQDAEMLPLTNVRLLAVSALGRIGTKDDLPLLQRLSSEDPLECVSVEGVLLEAIDGSYINLGKQEFTPPKRTEPSWRNVRSVFPVRSSALQAVQSIEARTGQSVGEQTRDSRQEKQ